MTTTKTKKTKCKKCGGKGSFSREEVWGPIPPHIEGPGPELEKYLTAHPELFREWQTSPRKGMGVSFIDWFYFDPSPIECECQMVRRAESRHPSIMSASRDRAVGKALSPLMEESRFINRIPRSTLLGALKDIILRIIDQIGVYPVSEMKFRIMTDSDLIDCQFGDESSLNLEADRSIHTFLLLERAGDHKSLPELVHTFCRRRDQKGLITWAVNTSPHAWGTSHSSYSPASNTLFTEDWGRHSVVTGSSSSKTKTTTTATTSNSQKRGRRHPLQDVEIG